MDTSDIRKLNITEEEGDLLNQVYDRLVRGRVMSRLLASENNPMPEYFEFELDLWMHISEYYNSPESFIEIMEIQYQHYNKDRGDLWPVRQDEYEEMNGIEYHSDLVTNEELEYKDAELINKLIERMNVRAEAYTETNDFAELDFHNQIVNALLADREYESSMELINFISELEYVYDM